MYPIASQKKQRNTDKVEQVFFVFKKSRNQHPQIHIDQKNQGDVKQQGVEKVDKLKKAGYGKIAPDGING
jgi:hypothetical protein